ncbi:nuclear RNA export factor 1-like isoform X1 [Diorhabda sublineata]|uniref:nuclear RNA export factor 1-like isoform X1 n=1 Tax=Diorhabda sublineata TaxID=1163346 RepID=UPI0024E0C289|nr:nuclear RNA export factor 1-like isoform X1 [Diorhabda sublineata]
MKIGKAANMMPNSGAVYVTASNLPTGIIYKNKALLSSQNYWHKFIVCNAASTSRNDILDAIMEQVYPMDLIPVSFWRDNHGANFLARNCEHAIEKLCKDNLVVANPKTNKKFQLNLVLKFATTKEFTIDIKKNILVVLTKRFNTLTKVLNLVKFHEEQDLLEYCPLSQPKIMFFVLHLAKSLFPHPEVYLLQNNGIKILNPLESLLTQVPYIKSIDLRYNNISNIDNLHYLNIFKLTELYLDGNPFCEKLSVDEYVKLITNTVKGLRKLDGQLLKLDNLPVAKRNYFCNFQVAPLVNQFLEHFYHVYDSNNREGLKELYHKDAMLSLNSTYYPNQVTSISARIHTYSQISRNLQKLANFSMMHNNLYLGNQQIANILLNLPATQHDPYSFTVDVMSYTNSSIILSISGVFKECIDGISTDERIYGFFRTFVIEIINRDGLCYIVNDQIHVYNALSWQVRDSFKYKQPLIETPSVPQNPEERKHVLKAIKLITNMNTQWCIKYLEECDYDLKNTLIRFVELFNQEKIPDHVFEQPKNGV